mgnify:CR=1 FL=1
MDTGSADRYVWVWFLVDSIHFLYELENSEPFNNTTENHCLTIKEC